MNLFIVNLKDFVFGELILSELESFFLGELIHSELNLVNLNTVNLICAPRNVKKFTQSIIKKITQKANYI